MAVTQVTTASEIQADFMRLLIAQMQNQDPLEPMDNYQMASQLTLFSQLQQLESISGNFSEMLDAAQRTYANSLLGKEVDLVDPSDSGRITTGIVQEIKVGADGQPLLVVGNQDVPLESVQAVRDSVRFEVEALSSG